MFTKLGRILSQQFSITEGVCREEPELEPRPCSKELQANEVTAAQGLHPQEQDNEDVPGGQRFTSTVLPEEDLADEHPGSSEHQLRQLKGRASSAADYVKQIIDISNDEGMSLSQKIATQQAAAEAALDILRGCASREAGISQPHDVFVPGLASEGEALKVSSPRESATCVVPCAHGRTGLRSDAGQPSQLQKSFTPKAGALHSEGGKVQMSSLHRPPFVDWSFLCSSDSASSLEYDAFHYDADAELLVLDIGSSYSDSEGDCSTSQMPQRQFGVPSNVESSTSLTYSCTANGQSTFSLSEAGEQCQKGLHRYYSARLSDLSDTQSSGGIHDALPLPTKSFTCCDQPSGPPDAQSTGGMRDVLPLPSKSFPYSDAPSDVQTLLSPTTSLMSSRASTSSAPAWSMRARYIAQAQAEKYCNAASLLQGFQR